MTNNQLTALKRNIESFDIEAFKQNQLKLYLLADALESTAMDLIQQMKAVGVYKFDDKRAIDAIQHNAGCFVRDLDKMCTEDYACQFGDIADEFTGVIDVFLNNQIKLKHKNSPETGNN